MLCDPISPCSEHLFPMFVGLEFEIQTVELCGADEWHIGLFEE